MSRATVIIPTFDHGPLLRLSVASALAQTWADLEVVVICDGAPDSTRDILDEVVAADDRVSYRWYEKGERLGETHRNAVLADCTSDFVCYLSDDDLWAPTHVAAMRRALESSDLAHTNHLFVDGDGALHVVAVDLNDPIMRDAHLSGTSFVCLSTLGHTMEAVRAGGLRWSVTPPDRYTDWYFVTGAIERGLRVSSTDAVTLLNLAGVFRKGWSIERRGKEMEVWRDAVERRWGDLVMGVLLARVRDSRSERLAHVAWSSATIAEHESRRDDALAVASDLERQLQSSLELLAASEIEVGRLTAVMEERTSANEREIGLIVLELRRAEEALVAESSALSAARERLNVLAATKMVRLQQQLARSRVIRRLLGGKR